MNSWIMGLIIGTLYTVAGVLIAKNSLIVALLLIISAGLLRDKFYTYKG